MDALILNLTRFGDLLQTQPVLAGLQGQGVDAGLVCLENFAEAAYLVQPKDRIFPFPGAGLLADLDRAWPSALHRLHSWREHVRSRGGHASLFNLTASQSARLLARFLATESSRDTIGGFALDDDGFGCFGNAWAAFLQMSSAHRGCSPFNLVDVMQRASGLPVAARSLALNRPGEHALQKSLLMLREQSPVDCKGYVAFQLGASERRRQWPEAYFAQLGDLLWKHFRLCPALLGAQSERTLAAHYAQNASAPYIDLVGRTTILELAAALCHARLLVTNDTGTMHLAAGLHRPIAAIFLATAQPWDTGPCQEDCLCFEPDLECHPCSFGQNCPHSETCCWAVTAQLVFDWIVKHWLAEDRPASALDQVVPGARIWMTCWDSHGYADLSGLSGQENAFRTQWIRIQRHYYRQFLDHAAVILPYESSFQLPEETKERITASLEKSQALLRLLQQQALVLSQDPLQKVKRKFLAYWERLQAYWQEDPHFSVLGRLWLVESQESGRDVRGVLLLTERYLMLVQAWMAMFPKDHNSGMKIESP